MRITNAARRESDANDPDNSTDLIQLCLNLKDQAYGYALRLTKNSTDAQDLMQEAFVRILKFQGSYIERGNLKSWLFKIIFRLFINKYRVTKRTQQLHDEIREQVGSALETEEQEYSIKELRAHYSPQAQILRGADLELFLARIIEDHFPEEIAIAFSNLPEYQRSTLVLIDVLGFSYRETATILDIRIGTVMSRITRCRDELAGKQLMKQRASIVLGIDPEKRQKKRLVQKAI